MKFNSIFVVLALLGVTCGPNCFGDHHHDRDHHEDHRRHHEEERDASPREKQRSTTRSLINATEKIGAVAAVGGACLFVAAYMSNQKNQQLADAGAAFAVGGAAAWVTGLALGKSYDYVFE